MHAGGVKASLSLSRTQSRYTLSLRPSTIRALSRTPRLAVAKADERRRNPNARAWHRDRRRKRKPQRRRPADGASGASTARTRMRALTTHITVVGAPQVRDRLGRPRDRRLEGSKRMLGLIVTISPLRAGVGGFLPPSAHAATDLEIVTTLGTLTPDSITTTVRLVATVTINQPQNPRTG